MDWMSEFKVSQLPVVNNEQLLGLITEDDLLDSEGSDTPIGGIRLTLPEKTFVYEDSHFYEVLKVASLLHLDILPVLKSRDNTYLGVITKNDIVDYSGEILSAKEKQEN